jgi:hypothetical protein
MNDGGLFAPAFHFFALLSCSLVSVLTETWLFVHVLGSHGIWMVKSEESCLRWEVDLLNCAHICSSGK